jgi:hypothetical protein
MAPQCRNRRTDLVKRDGHEDVALTRRRLLATSATAGVGVSILMLPLAAEASSVTDPAATPEPPNSFIIDDSAAPDAGDDVAYLVTLLQSSGAVFGGEATVTLLLSRDDGSEDGSGSAATGATIDGAPATSTTKAVVDGLVRVSVRFPEPGIYLVRILTDPAAVALPDGVTLYVDVR